MDMRPESRTDLTSSIALIRPAKRGDALFLAWAILTASRGHLPKGWFDIALNKCDGELIQFLIELTTAKTRSRWHYSRFLVAEVRAGVVAALCAFRAGDAYLTSPGAVTEVAETLGISVAEQAIIWQRGAYLFACTPRSDDNVWVIESAATLPTCRHEGYADALLMQAVENGRGLGLKEAEVCILIGNAPAERTCEKGGFRFSKEWRDAGCEVACGSPGLRRLVKTL